MQKDAQIFRRIFFEHSQREETKFVHFALITSARYCTLILRVPKPQISANQKITLIFSEDELSQGSRCFEMKASFHKLQLSFH